MTTSRSCFRFPPSVAALLLSVSLIASAATAEDVLFFGNSFTSANDIPQIVRAVAASKRKAVVPAAITPGGVDWAQHLVQPATDVALTSRPWHWVVLQDQSLRATRVRGVDEFLRYGRLFYDRIAARSPAAKIVLYETWAYAPGHPIYAPMPDGSVVYAGPAEMSAEIQQAYASLQVQLQELEPKRTVVLAPVGAAFARCLSEHPAAPLFAQDGQHPSVAGSYLSALVIYATIFNDSPVGATRGNLNLQLAKSLQEVADEVTKASRTK